MALGLALLYVGAFYGLFYVFHLQKLIFDTLRDLILQRVMRMLEPDDRFVCSTCSLNPFENEAVIPAALDSNTGKRF
jgi:hypothetical protein